MQERRVTVSHSLSLSHFLDHPCLFLTLLHFFLLGYRPSVKVCITRRNDLVLNVLVGGCALALLKLAEPVSRRRFRDTSRPTDYFVSPSFSFLGLPCPREPGRGLLERASPIPSRKRQLNYSAVSADLRTFPQGELIYACVLDYSAVEEATAKLTLRKVIAEGQRDAGVSERVSFVVARVREKKRE